MSFHPNLNPDKALIFRITHRQNVPWILRNGMYCRNATMQDPGFRRIGNVELIDRRHHRRVPIAPGGTLSDYIPFYFTPFTPMFYNIRTGYGNVTKLVNDEIVIFVSSLYRAAELGAPFVFTDQHAYPPNAGYFSDLADLNRIDWKILQHRDFKADPEDPAKIQRYQAEALIYGHLPCAALLGLVCYNDTLASALQREADSAAVNIKAVCQPGWYF
jgi:hypothetical protein